MLAWFTIMILLERSGMSGMLHFAFMLVSLLNRWTETWWWLGDMSMCEWILVCVSRTVGLIWVGGERRCIPNVFGFKNDEY